MRVFITVLVLIFSLQSLTKADDIRDFEIEGLSIGDSLLDYMNQEEITNNFTFLYKDKTFATILYNKITIYDDIQIALKTDDPKFIIQSISAKLYYDKNYQECLKKKIEITQEFKSVISSKTYTQSEDNIPRKKIQDPSGKSIYSYFAFYFDDGSAAQIFCTDWSKEITDEKGWQDNLKASLYSKKFAKYLIEQ